MGASRLFLMKVAFVLLWLPCYCVFLPTTSLDITCDNLYYSSGILGCCCKKTTAPAPSGVSLRFDEKKEERHKRQRKTRRKVSDAKGNVVLRSQRWLLRSPFFCERSAKKGKKAVEYETPEHKEKTAPHQRHSKAKSDGGHSQLKDSSSSSSCTPPSQPA